MKLAPLLKRLNHHRATIQPISIYHRLYSADVAPPKDPTNKFTYPSLYDPYGPSPPPSQKILDLAEKISTLSLEEIKQIGPALLVRLNQPLPLTMSGQGFAGPQAGLAGKSEEKKKEEKTAYDIKLEKFDAASKIKVIKEVRSFTSLGLKEAKDLVEKVPVVLKQGVTKEEAKEIIDKIKAVGGVAVME